MSDVATGTKPDAVVLSAVEIPSDESVDEANDLAADTTGDQDTIAIIIGVVIMAVVIIPAIVLCVFWHRNDCAGGDLDTGNRQYPKVVEDTKYV